MIVRACRLTSDHGPMPPFMMVAEHGVYSASHPAYHTDDVPDATRRACDRLAELVAADLGMPPRGWPDGVPYPIEEMP